jgi:O-antigen polymerase
MEQPALASENNLVNNKLDLSNYYLMSIAFLFLVAMHYFQTNIGGYGLHIAFNSTSWIAISIIIAFGFVQWARTGFFKLSSVDYAILVVFIVLLVPLIWSESPWKETAYDRYLGILAFIFIIFSYRQFSFSNKQQTLFWVFIVIAVLIQCLFGLIQLIFNDIFSYVKNFRPVGNFQQTNTYATFIATGLGISIYLYLNENLKRPFVLLSLLVIFLGALLETLVQSRTGILGCLISITALFILFRKQKQRIFIIFGLIALGVSLGVFLKHQDGSQSRIEEATKSGYRSIIYPVSIDLIKTSPFRGYGLGQFQAVYMEKQAEYFSLNPEIQPATNHAVSFPHNEIMYWWIEGGILPVLALVIFGLWLTIKVWKYGTILNKVSWICAVPILLHTQTEYPLYHSVPHLALLAFLVASMSPTELRNHRVEFKFLPRIIGVALPLFTTAFMVTNLQTIWSLKRYSQTLDGNYLANIINPFGQPDAINHRKAIVLNASPDPEIKQLALDYLTTETNLRPSSGSLWYQYLVQKELGQLSNAEETLARAKYLFPSAKVFQSVKDDPENTTFKN